MTTTRTLWLTVTTKSKQPVEVAFPIYRRHDVGGDGYESVIYTRIAKDMSAVSVQVTRRYGSHEVEYELTVTPRYVFDDSTQDYHLGRGEYESSEAEFYRAVDDLRAVVVSLPPREAETT